MFNANQKNRRGVAAVEMAIVLPVFLLVVLGIIEFGRGMMVEQLLANSARLGARRAILEYKTNSEVEQVVGDFFQSTSAATVDVAISINGLVGANLLTAERGDLIEVSVSVPFSNVSFLPMPQWLDNATLKSSCTMEHE